MRLTPNVGTEGLVPMPRNGGCGTTFCRRPSGLRRPEKVRMTNPASVEGRLECCS